MVLECLVSTQMATQSKVQGSKEIVKKEEVIDCYSTMADAGDHSKPLEKTKRSIDSMFRRSVKVEISPAKVENTEFRQPAKTAKKESSILSPPSRVVKKEERDDNISTMVLLDKSSPSSPVPLSKSGKNKKKEKIRSHEALKFKDGAPDTLPLPPVSSPVDSTSLAEGANKTVAHVSISPSSTKRSRYGSPVRNESRTATTYVDHGVNTHSIWESEAEDSHGDGSSNVEDNGNEATISNKHVVETNTDDASSVLNGGQLDCLDCGAVFETNDAFKVHIASHGGYRRYKCNVCGLRFINSGNLNVHMRKHTGEKPFKCDVCEKTFTLNGHLQRHRLIHTGERPFKCIVCNKGFSQSAHFRRHTLIHTGEKPYRCLRCGKCFNQLINLQRHMRTHTGERPYKCAVCDKSFSEPGNFRRHKLIHTGEKPYNCLTCGKWFNQNSNLKLHRRTHEDFNGVTRQDVSQDCVDRPSSMDNDAVNGQKIFYKTKSIDYVVEKKASRNPNVVYLVWSKQFTIELASAVAHSGYNCILCVKKIQPESFRDVVKLSNSLHTSLVEVGPDSKTLRLFSFGGIILPEKITNHGRFKSMAKLEAKLKRFVRSQEMEMVNIFKHSAKNNGWYKSLRLGLKGDCIITDKI